MGRPVCIVILMVTLVSLGACGTKQPVAAWQHAFEAYINEHGNGDLNAIRAATPDGNRFDLIGAREGGVPFISSSRTDVNGVLIAHNRDADQLWHIYLVGVIEYSGGWETFPTSNATLTEIRGVGVTATPTGLAWAVGPEQPEALGAFIGMYEDRGTPAAFPGRGTRFDVQTSGQVISIELVEPALGMSPVWTIDRAVPAAP